MVCIMKKYYCEIHTFALTYSIGKFIFGKYQAQFNSEAYLFKLVRPKLFSFCIKQSYYGFMPMVGGKIKNTCLVIVEKTVLVKMVGFYNLCEIIVSSVDVWFMIKRAAYEVLHVFFTFYPFLLLLSSYKAYWFW